MPLSSNQRSLDASRILPLGSGVWCPGGPASLERSEADLSPVDTSVHFVRNTGDNKLCKYHCKSGCDGCTGTEPKTSTWCSASATQCTEKCGGTYCPKTDMSFLEVIEKAPEVKVQGFPVAKNCAYGCSDGCPRHRMPGDTNGCAAWESGDSFCNLSRENCESCRTRDYGRGEWCPAGW